MKFSKAHARRKCKKIPYVEFETEGAMTAFAGLVVFQALFKMLNLKERLCRCFSHLDGDAVIRHGVTVLLVVVQILVGQRRLRGRDLLVGDPMITRILGLSELPDVATISRVLSGSDRRSVDAVGRLARTLVLDRLQAESLRVVTTDFDGSVQFSKGHAEGTAVGFNKKKKGARSYYPLLCTIAQTGQVFDLHHRPGNVHDSNGALEFMRACHAEIRKRLPAVRLESRFDSAFFDQKILDALDEDGVQFTVSVPFRRFPELKQRIQAVDKWRRINDTWSYAECNWKPKSWDSGYRLVLYRKRRIEQLKGPLQLDLFEPRDYTYEFKVVATNKVGQHPRTVLHFHNGRGSQEKIIGEVKQHAAFDVIATKTLNGNRLFTLAGIIAHNLARELQMVARAATRSTWPKRPALWVFQSLGTLRRHVIRRVGRFVRPQNRLTLRLGAQPEVQVEIETYMEALENAA